MNERIKELAEQAHCYACEYEYSPHNPYNQAMYKERYDSKFAELIVKECADVGSQWAEGLIDTKHYAFVNKKIKEHFGVEE